MNLLIPTLLMLTVMLLSIYAMTRGKAIEAEIVRLVDTKPVEQIYSEYIDNNRTLNLYVLGGILLTGSYALIFFGAGGIDPRKWDLENWVFAVIGMVATVAITMGQRGLYTNVKQNLAALLVTLLILSFVIFSEVGTSSEREASIVRDRSLDSPTLNTVMGQIATPDIPPANRAAYYQKEASRWQSLANSCKGNCKRANQAKADSFTAAAEQAERDFNTALLSQQQNKMALIEQSKSMEYQESHHTAIVRWLKEISTGTFAAAMIFASYVFVIAFESGFHFTGTRNGIYIEALSRLGYTVKKRYKMPSRSPSMPPKTETPVNSVPEPPTRDSTPVNNMHDMHVETGEEDEIQRQKIADMKLFYNAAKIAKTGDNLLCPTCANDFVKKTYQQCFCQPKCRDAYWNLIDPERLKAARGGQTANIKTSLSDDDLFAVNDAVRNGVISGEIKPTVRPVTDKVTHVLQSIGKGAMGKPQRQQVAQKILDELAADGVIVRNTEGGVGKPKYVLATGQGSNQDIMLST